MSAPIVPTDLETTDHSDDRPTEGTSRRGRRWRFVVPFLAGLLVAGLALTAFFLSAGGDTLSADDADASEAVENDSKAGRELAQAEPSSSTTTIGAGLRSPGGASIGGANSSSASGAANSGAPQLETVGNIVLDPGIYERDLVLRNTGSSPLTWNATPEAGDVVEPSAGVIPAGSDTLVHLTADEYSTGSKNWTHTVIVHSDGGDAQIDVQGTTLLPPMPEIVGGTQVNQLGNVYVFDNGAINVGLQIKNDGDLPLHIGFATAAGARVHGDPNRVIEGGQIEFVAFSLCDQPAPVVPTQIDVELYIDAGPYGAGTLILRFTQMAGQPTGPC